mgnify:CR=1 FL=1|tara:strand:- start:2522 stop:2770 length:249 start_codon:yes stop_codon:yes gene_type:complete
MTSKKPDAPEAPDAAANTLTARNKKFSLSAIVLLLLMRVFDVSEGDWERIRPAVMGLWDLLWPVIAGGTGVLAQQFFKKHDD